MYFSQNWAERTEESLENSQSNLIKIKTREHANTIRRLPKLTVLLFGLFKADLRTIYGLRKDCNE